MKSAGIIQVTYTTAGKIDDFFQEKLQEHKIIYEWALYLININQINKKNCRKNKNKRNYRINYRNTDKNNPKI